MIFVCASMALLSIAILQVLYEVSFSSVLPPSSDVANAAVACHYLSDLRQVVVAYSNGDVITLETAMCSEGATGAVPDEAVDCIGTIDAGIAAMCWSPDEEVSPVNLTEYE